MQESFCVLLGVFHFQKHFLEAIPQFRLTFLLTTAYSTFSMRAFKIS